MALGVQPIGQFHSMSGTDCARIGTDHNTSIRSKGSAAAACDAPSPCVDARYGSMAETDVRSRNNDTGLIGRGSASNASHAARSAVLAGSHRLIVSAYPSRVAD